MSYSFTECPVCGIDTYVSNHRLGARRQTIRCCVECAAEARRQFDQSNGDALVKGGVKRSVAVTAAFFA
ncbi:hypothetical protein ACWIBQ_03375 [Microbacterium keratanolyticum]